MITHYIRRATAGVKCFSGQQMDIDIEREANIKNYIVEQNFALFVVKLQEVRSCGAGHGGRAFFLNDKLKKSGFTAAAMLGIVYICHRR